MTLSLPVIISVILTVMLMLPAALIVFYYGTRSPWTRSGIGKAFMMLIGTILATSLVSLTRLLIPSQPWLLMVQAGIILAATFALWVIFAVLRDVQKHDAKYNEETGRYEK